MISLSQQTFTEGDRVRLCGGDEWKEKMKTKGIQMEENKGRRKADETPTSRGHKSRIRET